MEVRLAMMLWMTKCPVHLENSLGVAGMVYRTPEDACISVLLRTYT